jgi:hypothetical protein
MNDITIALAALLPFESIIEKLEREISEYKMNPCEETKGSLCAVAAMLLTNHMADGSIEGAMKLSSRMEQMDQREKLFSNKEN